MPELLQLDGHSARAELKLDALRNRTQVHDDAILIAQRYAAHAAGQGKSGLTGHIVSPRDMHDGMLCASRSSRRVSFTSDQVMAKLTEPAAGVG
jgi:hypothetical protein